MIRYQAIVGYLAIASDEVADSLVFRARRRTRAEIQPQTYSKVFQVSTRPSRTGCLRLQHDLRLQLSFWRNDSGKL